MDRMAQIEIDLRIEFGILDNAAEMDWTRRMGEWRRWTQTWRDDQFDQCVDGYVHARRCHAKSVAGAMDDAIAVMALEA